MDSHVERDCIRSGRIRYCVKMYISQESKVCKKSRLQSEQISDRCVGGRQGIKVESK